MGLFGSTMAVGGSLSGSLSVFKSFVFVFKSTVAAFGGLLRFIRVVPSAVRALSDLLRPLLCALRHVLQLAKEGI